MKRRFTIEQLESRRVLATLTVTTLSDSGSGSLREAIEFANADTGGASGADEIVFNSDLMGTIALESMLPTITDDLTITGPAAEQLILDAGKGVDPDVDGDGFRIFLLDDGINENLIDVVIRDLTLTGGDVAGEVSGAHGGAVLTAENLTIVNATITGNRIDGFGGGVSAFGYSNGSTIVSRMTLTIVNTTVDGNIANGAGGVFSQADSLTIRNTSISGNTGGGLTVGGSSTAIVDDSTISNNTNPNQYGGGASVIGDATFTNCVMEDNEASSGGAIFFNGGGLLLSDCIISGNTATVSGGAVLNYFNRSMTIERTTLANNYAGERGGAISVVDFSSATIVDSTLHDNTAGSLGGAVSLLDSTVRVANSTISNNAAPQGSAIHGRNGGAAVDTTVDIDIAFSTIFNNGVTDSNGPIDITHSILTEPVQGTLDVNSFNLVSATPGVAPLADNGGPTKTHALLDNSLALNTGAPTAMAGEAGVPLYDQRGAEFDRIAGGRIDIGAFERPTDSWHNFGIATDVNGDRATSPLDALLVINELNDRQFSSRETGQLDDDANPPPFLDVVADGIVAPNDALVVINSLNASGRVNNRNLLRPANITTASRETAGSIDLQSLIQSMLRTIETNKRAN